MREIDGLEYQEIADAIGCSIGTVMSRLFYARKKLQTMLRDVHEQL
jgi:RNA polymerase sigma-70 factor (ECF subfamily)